VGKKVPKGFVSREGEAFKLDGKDFYFAGSNAYYFPFNDASTSVQALYRLLTSFSSLLMSKLGSVQQRRLA